MTESPDTQILLRDARVWGLPGLVEVRISDGRVSAITPSTTVEHTRVPAPRPAEDGAWDLDGALVLPGFVDAHCHLDKTLWGGPWVPNTAGSAISDKIAYVQRRRAEFGVPDTDRIAALLRHVLAQGTTAVRTHTDVCPELGLDGFAAVRAAADTLEGRISVQQVAFPQFGMLTNPGTVELMDRALRSGAAQVVGGIDPAGVDRDPVRHLDTVFGLALEHAVPVDIHLHDRGGLGAWQFEAIIERTLSTGMAHRVTISHGYALGDVDPAHRTRLIAGLAEAGIAMTTCAAHDDPVPPLREMAAAGAVLAAGNDGIRDLWSPYGDGDMLHRAYQLASRAQCYADPEIELALRAATAHGASVLGLPAHGVEVGARADLVVVAARSAAEAVVSRPPRAVVIGGGRTVIPA
ncbi:amidohydrolase [Nocardia takedensis]